MGSLQGMQRLMLRILGTVKVDISCLMLLVLDMLFCARGGM
jgi:hypothetical protein